MTKNPDGFVLRRRVARHVRKFYAEWTAQLAAGTSAIWNQVEYRLAARNEVEGAAPDAGDLPQAAMNQPMQRQPMQQQQTKASPEKT
jgi:hypothetical protein